MPPCPRPPQGCHSCGGVGSGDAVSCLFLGLCCVGLGLTSKRGRDGCGGLCPLSSHPSPPPQAQPTDMRALQDFEEPDKLHIQMNDIITVIEGRYCTGGVAGIVWGWDTDQPPASGLPACVGKGHPRNRQTGGTGRAVGGRSGEGDSIPPAHLATVPHRWAELPRLPWEVRSPPGSTGPPWCRGVTTTALPASSPHPPADSARGARGFAPALPWETAHRRAAPC